MTKVHYAVLVAVAFAAGLAGANVTPLLTGAGKIIFPEASPSANIFASSGALTVAAGGTNKNVVLTPTGTGVVLAPIVTGGTTTTSPLKLRSTTGAGVAGADIVFQTGNNGATEVARFLNNGRLGIGIAAPGFLLDVSGGDINTSGVYQDGGTPGVTSTCTLCSITSTGGIVTAVSNGAAGLFGNVSIVTGSRSIGSVFQNTSGKPMFVVVTARNNSVPTTINAFTDGSNPPTNEVAEQGYSTTGLNMSIGFMVLSNNFYKVTISAGTPTLAIWTEYF